MSLMVIRGESEGGTAGRILVSLSKKKRDAQVFYIYFLTRPPSVEVIEWSILLVFPQ